VIMRYIDLYPNNFDKKTDNLSECFKCGHSIGPVTVSKDFLFIKKGFRIYFIAYTDAQKIFRRVRRLHANICCGDGDLEVEYLVIYADNKELMEITLPGKKAAQLLMSELKQTSPNLDVTAPSRSEDSKEETV